MALFPADRRDVPRHFDSHSAGQGLPPDDALLVPIAYPLLRARLVRPAIDLIRRIAEGVFILLHDSGPNGLLPREPALDLGTGGVAIRRAIVAWVTIDNVIIEDSFLFLLAIAPLLHLHRDRQGPNLYVRVLPGYFV